MGLSLNPAAPAAHRITAEDRVERIGQLTTRQLTDALLWLAGYAPDVFDVVADAVEPFAGDGSEDPAPFCAVCGGDIGVFLKFGLDWRHYRGTDLTDLGLFEPGHRPVLAWPGALLGWPRSPRELRSRRKEAAGPGASSVDTVADRVWALAMRWPYAIGQQSAAQLPAVPGLTAVIGKRRCTLIWTSVYTIDSSNGDLQETYLLAIGDSWTTQNMSANYGTPPAEG